MAKKRIKTAAQFLKDAAAIAKSIGAERDKLRRLLEDYQEILGATEDSARDLEDLIERMSEQV